jgi:hypothetical protein
MKRSHVPALINKGRDSTRSPDFSADEYRNLIRTLPSWIDKGREGKSRGSDVLCAAHAVSLPTRPMHSARQEN